MMGSMALDLEQNTARCRIICLSAATIAMSIDPPPARGSIGSSGARIDVADESDPDAHLANTQPMA